MRIIGGAAGGRKIRAPKGAATRPTADRVREAIFNMLGPLPPSTRVLDLYAGAGGLGLEALSRGATEAVFVDRSGEAVRCILENLRALGFSHRARVHRADVVPALGRLLKEGRRFDLVLLDPPYFGDEAARALSCLAGPAEGLLAEDAVLVVEHDRRMPLEHALGVLCRHDERQYGDTVVSFYRRAA
ncbi:MAG: 16S rRNA (guanine(966)-N(2))-methyltransferase RsmD [Deltaproteobacteria bacterium]|nr:16S rRNA (guanine(966)-N(2))-methyltransferase RsmD [Deltaproteobacteria bacterium]